MFRKRILLLSLTAALTFGLMACNQSEISSDDGDVSGLSGDDNETITLQFWGGVPAEAGPQEVVDNWNEQNPDVQVEYTRFVNDDDGNLRLNTALQTGQNVDMFVGYGTDRLQERVDSGFALDLSQFDDYDIDEKMGDRAEYWKIDDTYYALPTKESAAFIYVNEDILNEQGLEVPEKWTWNELKDYAEQLTTDEHYGYIEWEPTIGNILGSAVIDQGWVKDDGTSNLDHPNVRKALEIFNEMMNKDQSMLAYGEQIATNIAPDHMFLNGEVAMFGAFEGILRMSNDLEEFPRDFTISFAPFPQFEGSGKVAQILGDSISISADTEYPEESWEFMKWYADGGMLPLARGGRVPSSKDAPMDSTIDMMVEGAAETYDVEALERMFDEGGTLLDPLPLEAEDAIEQEYEKYFLGEQDLDTTIENMVERHNQYLEKNK